MCIRDRYCACWEALLYHYPAYFISHELVQLGAFFCIFNLGIVNYLNIRTCRSTRGKHCSSRPKIARKNALSFGGGSRVYLKIDQYIS